MEKTQKCSRTALEHVSFRVTPELKFLIHIIVNCKFLHAVIPIDINTLGLSQGTR